MDPDAGRFHASDNEPLATELTRYDKGQRRVARLISQATYGLIYLQQLSHEQSPAAEFRHAPPAPNGNAPAHPVPTGYG